MDLVENFFLCSVDRKKGNFLYSPSKKTFAASEPIVGAKEMALYEKSLIDKDPCLSEKFMDIAALGLMKVLENKVLGSFSCDKVVLLVGKGNNGGDALALGSLLLQSGYEVICYQFFPETSFLAEKKGEIFEENGGERIICDPTEVVIGPRDLVIDGLLGTGFCGKVTGVLERAIIRCNQLSSFTFSIDIPSGIDGNTGEVKGVAIRANMTAYLGALKVGHLYEDGYDYVGALHYVDFGMSVDGIKAYAHLANEQYILHSFPKRGRCVHKYLVGEVSIFGGSNEMSGAANLAALAAYRSGAGLVRHFYLEGTPSKVEEVISKKLDDATLLQDISRSKAILVGPGLGRSENAKALVKEILAIDTVPKVVDADALYLMGAAPKEVILTPHKGELIHLLQLEKGISSKDLLNAAQKYCDDNKVVMIVKGMPTTIISPKQEKLVLVAGNAGMATAGSGDVLSGILVAFLAAGLSLLDAALLGVYVHGRAGDVAAYNLSITSLIASDIIQSLGEVYSSLESE